MIYDYVKKHREALGLTRRELAERVGMSPQVIHNYENGGCAPSVEVRKRMAVVFGVPVKEILAQEKKPSVSEVESERREYAKRKKACGGCKHWRHLSSSEYSLCVCHYILDTGHRRPCPAENCTEYEKGKKPKQQLSMGGFVLR